MKLETKTKEYEKRDYYTLLNISKIVLSEMLEQERKARDKKAEYDAIVKILDSKIP